MIVFSSVYCGAQAVYCGFIVGDKLLIVASRLFFSHVFYFLHFILFLYNLFFRGLISYILSVEHISFMDFF